MKELMFFDANCRIGSYYNGGGAPDAKALLDEMDYYGVDQALVRHSNLGKGAEYTNECLAELLREDTGKRLTGVWCILPEQCGELPAPNVFFAKMKECRIAALTLSPFEHRYVPCRLTLGTIMDAAKERRIPVLLNAFAGKWAQLYQFLAEFPDNIFIYQESWGKWGCDRNIRPLLERYKNFYFEITGYWVPEGIRDLVERYGAKRILYGSGFHTYNHGAAMLQLRHSGLKQSDLEMIAGKNLENILKGVAL